MSDTNCYIVRPAVMSTFAEMYAIKMKELGVSRPPDTGGENRRAIMGKMDAAQ